MKAMAKKANARKKETVIKKGLTDRSPRGDSIDRSAATDTYEPAFRFNGKIERVDIELEPRNLTPEEEIKLHEMHAAYAEAHD